MLIFFLKNRRKIKVINATNEAIHLERSQTEKATEILTNAFYNDPMFGCIIPETEPAKYNALKWFCRMTLDVSQPYNHIYTTPDELKGIAAWLPPGHASISMLQLLQAGLYALPFKLGWKKSGRFMSLFSLIEERHIKEMPNPHWYLFMLGVSPSYQNQGIGSTLLQPILKQANSDGLPCYLQTSTESAIRFYKRHGFEILWKGELPGDNACIWTMKREPV
jgi:ribosomal protein S18 acetylase RimI-like enzyme